MEVYRPVFIALHILVDCHNVVGWCLLPNYSIGTYSQLGPH